MIASQQGKCQTNNRQHDMFSSCTKMIILNYWLFLMSLLVNF